MSSRRHSGASVPIGIGIGESVRLDAAIKIILKWSVHSEAFVMVWFPCIFCLGSPLTRFVLYGRCAIICMVCLYMCTERASDPPGGCVHRASPYVCLTKFFFGI